MRRERITHAKFSLLVIVVTIIIFLIGIIGTSGIKKMNHNVQSLYSDGLLPLQYLTQIRYAYLSEVLNTSDELEEHAMPYSRAAIKLASAQQLIDSNWVLFIKTVLTNDERVLVNNTIEKKKAVDELVNHLIKRINAGDTLYNAEDASEEISKAVSTVIVKINQLDQLQIDSSNEAQKQNEKLYKESELEFYILIALSVLFISILGFYILQDISQFINDLKNSNLKVKESEEKYRYLFQNNPAHIFLWDLSSLKILEVNDTVIAKYGYSKEEWADMILLDFRPEKDHDSVMALAKRVINENLPITKAVWKHLKKNGEEMLMEIVSHKVDYQGKQAILSIAIDVTEQEKAKLALNKTEERNSALIENINDGIVLIYADGTVFYQSPSVTKIVGWTLEDRRGQKAIDFIHPNDVNVCKEFFNYSKNNPREAVKTEYRTRHKDGHYIWVELFITNLLDNENIKAYVVSYRDITERKAFEEQQRLMSSIVNSSDDAIISKTLDGIITSWNYGAEKILGYKAEDVIGKHVSIIVPPDLLDEEDDILTRISKGESIDHYETQRIKKGGELIYASLTVSPIIDSLGKVVGTSKILRDITNEKRSEKKLTHQNVELMKTNAELDRFVYSVSHELRMPLTAVMGLHTFIDKTPLSERDKGLMDMIRKSVYNMDDTLRGILDYSRNNRLEPSMAPIDLPTLVNNAFENSEYHLEAVNLEKRITIQDNVPFYSDLLRIKIILNNLVSNAIKYSKKGIPDAFISIKIEVDKDKFLLEIADNGIGIESDYLPNVFKMFYRATSSVTGSGLGLYIVKESIERLGGSIEVTSEFGVGTKFMVQIPNGNESGNL